MNLAPETAAYGVPTRPLARVRVVPRSTLFHEQDGPRRGYAHAGFEELPREAPGFLQYGALRMVAEGTMYPGEGFAMHPHHNVDNLLLLRSGQLRHADNLGNECVLQAGTASFLSAGEHAEHSEYVEGEQEVQALLLFIQSDTEGGDSAYYRRDLNAAQPNADWLTVASGCRGAPAEALPLRADVEVSRALLEPNQRLDYQLFAGRRGYLVPLDGSVRVCGRLLQHGDRALLEAAGAIEIQAEEAAEIVLIDLPLSDVPARP